MRASRFVSIAFATAIAFGSSANPYLLVRDVFEPIERLSRRYPMPDVRSVTARDLSGAMRLPLRRRARVDDVRTPGDAREYRFGIHQGVDFYGVRKGEPVYPIAPGVVLRLDWLYTRMSRTERGALLKRCREVGGTPGSFGTPVDAKHGDILDRLRGRQVWVYHGRNATNEPVISIYGHLDSVARLPIGTFVTTRQAIGSVGNSGTSMEGISNTAETHLHLEVVIGADYWRVRRDDEIGVRLPADRERSLREETIRAFAASATAILPSTRDASHIEGRRRSDSERGGRGGEVTP